jgi:hypothetical protein
LAQLAHVIYLARATCYQLDVIHWEALSLPERHTYITMAEAVIEAVKPNAPLFELAAGLARAEAAKVIGSITPSTPWGVDPRK